VVQSKEPILTAIACYVVQSEEPILTAIACYVVQSKEPILTARAWHDQNMSLESVLLVRQMPLRYPDFL